MPVNVDLNLALQLIGYKTYQLELLQAQGENISNEFNKLQQENEALKARIAQLENPDGRLEQTNNQ